MNYRIIAVSVLSLNFAIAQDVLSQTCVDTDGDGWGWDGFNSCRMPDSTTGSSECIDTDGDGWG